MKGAAIVLGGFWLASGALAHQPETSYIRVMIEDNSIVTEIGFDVITLKRIAPAPLDADGDLSVSPAEMSAQTPAVYNFLRAGLASRINLKPADFGDAGPMAWPDALEGSPIVQREYHQHVIRFSFQQLLRSVPEDFTLEIADPAFAMVGRQHVFETYFLNGEDAHQASLSFEEPIYLYDTGRQPARVSLAPKLALGVLSLLAVLLVWLRRKRAKSSSERPARRFFAPREG